MFTSGANSGYSIELIAALDRGDVRAARNLVNRGAVVNCQNTAARPELSRYLSLALEEHLFRGLGLNAPLEQISSGINR